MYKTATAPRVKDFILPAPYVTVGQTILETIRFMSERNAETAVVVDGEGRPVGLVDNRHLLKAVGNEVNINLPVATVMTSCPLFLKENDHIVEASRLCRSSGFYRLPVTCGKDIVSGVFDSSEHSLRLIDDMESTLAGLYAAITAVPAAIVAVDARGTVIFFNNSAADLFGVKPEEAVGKAIDDINPHTGLMDAFVYGSNYSGIKQKINGKTVLAIYDIMVENRVIEGAVALFQDISEIEAIKAILDSTFDGIVITDNEGVLLRINKAYERITKLDSKKLLGSKVQDMVKDGIISKSATLEVLNTKKTATIVQRIETGRTMLVSASPIFDPKTGEIKYVICNCRDLTELNELQQKLEETTQLSEKYFCEVQRLRAQQLYHEDIVARSTLMQKALDTALKVAEVDCNVLLLGESGVGKEVVAKFIHKSGPRAGGPFIKVNCGAIPDNLLESELFGYEGGAFTGAQRRGKPGMFELSDHGTILLDEIGDLPLNLQVKLLNVIQDKEVKRVGGTTSRLINVRIIAATNQDLRSKVEEGTFRLDLFYRLNVVSIRIPSLRERKEDILPLLFYFLDKNNKKYKKAKKLFSEAINYLCDYYWPGNIRELENVVERIIVTSEGDYVSLSVVQDQLKGNAEVLTKAVTGNSAGVISPLEEKKQLLELYEKYRSTRKVAKILGVNQSTVARKLKIYRKEEE